MRKNILPNCCFPYLPPSRRPFGHTDVAILPPPVDNTVRHQQRVYQGVVQHKGLGEERKKKREKKRAELLRNEYVWETALSQGCLLANNRTTRGDGGGQTTLGNGEYTSYIITTMEHTAS